MITWPPTITYLPSTLKKILHDSGLLNQTWAKLLGSEPSHHCTNNVNFQENNISLIIQPLRVTGI